MAETDSEYAIRGRLLRATLDPATHQVSSLGEVTTAETRPVYARRCPAHPQGGVWEHRDGERCALCGYFFDGRDPPPRERTLEGYAAFVASKLSPAYKANLTYLVWGLIGERGEAVDAIKKFLFHSRRVAREKVLEELGDNLFYIVAVGRALGYSLEDIVEHNRTKLEARYPNGSADVPRPDDER